MRFGSTHGFPPIAFPSHNQMSLSVLIVLSLNKQVATEGSQALLVLGGRRVSAFEARDVSFDRSMPSSS
jgi:hypothetical protein